MDDELARVVGDRLKRLRVQSGVSLRGQARTIGISASSLSALENGRGGMSLGRLQLVAQHFGLHVSDLLGSGPATSGDPDRQRVEIIRRGGGAAHGDIRRGSATIYRLLGSGQGHILQPATITFEPGGCYERDRTGNANGEFAYVVFGDIELRRGKHTYSLGPGDSARFSATVPYAYRNASDSDMAFMIAVATPPW
jgi:transcriptional regulator with XRE-family HTH domain